MKAMTAEAVDGRGNPLIVFNYAIAAWGMMPPAKTVADGLLRRFSPTGKRSDDAGWYVLHLDGVPAGAFGNWRDGLVQYWCSKSKREMTPAERTALARRIEAMKRQRDAAERQRHADAAAAAWIRWAAAVPAEAHPYLTAKGVSAHGVRVDGDSLLIPMRDTEGHLHSLQAINPDGEKRFMSGGRVEACYHAIGRPSGKLFVCEGYATGATIHQESGHAVAVAFNKGNLLPAAKALRAKYPCITMVIAADDDWRTEGNPGLTAATEAAKVVGGLLAVPNFAGLQRGDKDTDFNDLHRLDAVTEAEL